MSASSTSRAAANAQGRHHQFLFAAGEAHAHAARTAYDNWYLRHRARSVERCFRDAGKEADRVRPTSLRISLNKSEDANANIGQMWSTHREASRGGNEVFCDEKAEPESGQATATAIVEGDEWGGPMSLTPTNEASHIKRRRATKSEVMSRRSALLGIVAEMGPMTVRQVFYQATVRGLVEKSESGYTKVQTDLVQMRRAGVLPYHWLADNTRWQRKPDTFHSIEEALHDTARFYRKALWADAGGYVEIWLEKDALSGVIYPVTSMYDVPLMVARGYASLSFLHGAADHIGGLDVPAFIYHFGDFDPSGVNAGEKIEQTLREMAPDAEIYFERVAVTLEQIWDWDLPTRPTKNSDTRSRSFGDISVELDAIAPEQLRQLVGEVIERHLPSEQFQVLKAAEASERDLIASLVTNLSVGRS
jgi:hypothetical protein